MVRDVYAGDDALRGVDRSSAAPGGFGFVVEADRDPDVLLRIAVVLGIGNVTPSRASLRQGEHGTVIIEVDLEGISEAAAESICRKMTQLTCVLSARFRRIHPGSTAPLAREPE